MHEEKKHTIEVFILDDEPIVCKRLKVDLELHGYRVETFTNSRDALNRLEHKDFDIVITDLKMEGTDGEQVIDRIKQKSPTTEVIVITGYATMECAQRCLKKGAFEFIAKPFKLKEIHMVVERANQKITGVFDPRLNSSSVSPMDKTMMDRSH